MAEMKVPTMVTIREAARRTGVSYDFIYKLCKRDEIVYVKAGSKYLINFEKFINFLNGGESDDGGHDVIDRDELYDSFRYLMGDYILGICASGADFRRRNGIPDQWTGIDQKK